MTRRIPARELSDTDILDFHAEAISPDGTVKIFHGIPIDKLTRHRDGRVEVDMTYIDGTHRFRVYGPDDEVVVM
jgi:hypothetical protein